MAHVTTMMGGRIRDVWADNLELEMAHLRQKLAKYPFVAIVRLRSPGYRVPWHCCTSNWHIPWLY